MKNVKADPVIADRDTRMEMREHATQINALVGIFGSVLDEYADDTAAAAGGVEIGFFYRTGSAVKQRVA